MVRPHTTRAGAIDYAASLHSEPLDYGFWDAAEFYCAERVAPSSGANDYLIDSTDPGIDFSVFSDAEGSPSYVKVLYASRYDATYPDGTLMARYVTSGSSGSTPPTWATASTVVDVWDEWSSVQLTADQADAIGAQILAWIDDNQYSGSITIHTPTVPKRGGGTKNSAYIRAGDYIEDSNLDTDPLMITSVTVDVDAGKVTLGIGTSRRAFVARINSVIAPTLTPNPSPINSGLPVNWNSKFGQTNSWWAIFDPIE
jgi:hypothetical protein